MTEINANSCEACGQPTARICEECTQHYCSSCKVQNHWQSCKAYKLCESPKLGFFVVAARDIHPDEVVFTEPPLILGCALPPLDDKLPCVACFRCVTKQGCMVCPQCLWPVCSLQCERIATKHEPECKILSQHQDIFLDSSTKSYRFDLLLALKTYLLQNTNKNEWNKLLDRLLKTSPCYENLELSHKLLEQLAKFLKSNTSYVDEVQVFYPTASLIEHSCLPNTSQTIGNSSNGYRTEIRALEAIKKDTPLSLSLSYVNLLEGTHARRQQLKSKNKKCCCDRCSDPTEFDTFFSALRCMGIKSEECGGAQLPINPLSSESFWICNKCGIHLFNDHVVNFVDHLGAQTSKILSTKHSREDLERFLQKLLIFLHPNHFHVFAIKQALVQSSPEDDLQELREELRALAQKLKIKIEL